MRQQQVRRRPRTVPVLFVLALLLVGLGFAVSSIVRAMVSSPSDERSPIVARYATESLRATAIPKPAVAATKAVDTPTPAFTRIPFPTSQVAPAGVEATMARTSPSTPTLLAKSQSPLPIADLQALMLRLVNSDRDANGLRPVVWDETAAAIGQKHAEEMARMDYFSHWDTAGRGPDTRYALEGGLASAMENISSRWDTRFIGRIGVSSSDWESAIREAQVGLMNSPGHRANILTPAHTQLGIGIAFNLNTGKLYIAQEFVDQYVKLVPLPNRLTTAADIEIRGELLGRASDPLVDIAFERKPSPLTPAQLNSQYAGAYSFQAQSINQFAASPQLNGRNFSTTLRIGQRGAGLYHVRVFVMVDGRQALTVDRVVVVEP